MTEEMKDGRLDLHNGKLAPCPKTPNGVSTDHPDPNRRMLPLPYDGISIRTAIGLLTEVIHTIAKSEVAETAEDYVHAVYRTPIFGLPHDAEFYFDDETKTVSCRSVSRVGIADFGMNKRWLQSVYARFLQKKDDFCINENHDGVIE